MRYTHGEQLYTLPKASHFEWWIDILHLPKGTCKLNNPSFRSEWCTATCTIILINVILSILLWRMKFVELYILSLILASGTWIDYGHMFHNVFSVDIFSCIQLCTVPRGALLGWQHFSTNCIYHSIQNGSLNAQNTLLLWYQCTHLEWCILGVLMGYCIPIQILPCFVLDLKIIGTFLKTDVHLFWKIVQGTQNGTEILVGQAVFQLWIKAAKMLFGSVTQEPLGLLKFWCYFWVPWTIYYKMHILLFSERCWDRAQNMLTFG